MSAARDLASLQLDPFALLERARTGRLTEWASVESDVLACLAGNAEHRGARDAEVDDVVDSVHGIIAQLVENGSGCKLGRAVPCGSTLFGGVDIPFCYPADGIAPLVGAILNVRRPHGGAAQKLTSGFDELRSRVQVAAWTSLDFKLHYAPPAPIASIGSWIHETRPRFYSLWLLHCYDHNEFTELRATMNALGQHCNGVGVTFFRSDAREPSRYVALPAPELAMDRVLREMVSAVVAAGTSQGEDRHSIARAVGHSNLDSAKRD